MRWYFGFFVVSGFCSLVYEVVWLRLAMAAFGVTTPLVSIVLSVFMAGVAPGRWVGGRPGARGGGGPPGGPRPPGAAGGGGGPALALPARAPPGPGLFS